MAWATHYRGEFNDLTYSGATEGLLWTIDIEEDGYSGAINTMLLTGQPLIIDHLAAGDDLIFSPIKGSKATINVISEQQFQYTGLYSSENLKYRVSIYYGDTPTLYWQGYLTTEYTEDYNDTPYNVSVTASDGLGLLKEMRFQDADNHPWGGRRYESQIILDILGKIGVTEFKEYVNLYDVLMDDGTDDSPFDQCLIDVDRFYGEQGDAWPCYMVIEEILKKYNAVIRQIRGEYIIYRPTELTGATVYGRAFTAYDTKTGISITPAQYVDRPGVDSAVADFNGGVLMMTSPISKFTAEQDYGYRRSWLDNYNFGLKDFSGFNPNYWIKDWTKVNITARWGDDGGVEITGASTGPSATDYLMQEFGIYGIISSTDRIRLSFNYEIRNETGAATDIDIWMKIADTTGTYWLQIKDDNELQWVTTGDIIKWTETTVAEGTTVLAFNRIVTGIPANGTFTVYLYYTKANTFLTIKNLCFNLTSDKIVQHINPEWKPIQRAESKYNLFGIIKFGPQSGIIEKYVYEFLDQKEAATQLYTATNAINAPEMVQTYLLGDVTKDETGMDNIIEQFMGSLVVIRSGALAQAAANFVAVEGIYYQGTGVSVWSIDNVLYFQANVPGVNFVGASSITNSSGDLAGTVATIQANAAAAAQVATIHLFGSSGWAKISAGGVTRLFEFDTSLAQTAASFVTSFSTAYATVGITLSYDGDIILTEATAGGGFGNATITNISGTLRGVLYDEDQTAAQVAQARIDTITLTGTSGAASITVDEVAATVSIGSGTSYAFTSSWHTRGGTENIALLQLITNEIRTLYGRERHFIQMQLRENSVDTPDVNILYNLMDTANRYNNYTRIFAFNRGTLDVKKREWSADIMEIGVSSTALYTTDDDNTTVDSTSITVDSD